MYPLLTLIAGGDWNNAENCGSRSRNANNVRSSVSGAIGGRGSIQEFIVLNGVLATPGWDT